MRVHPFLSLFVPAVALHVLSIALAWVSMSALPFQITVFLITVCATFAYTYAFESPDWAPIKVLTTADGQTYLTRWNLITTPNWRVYLHRLSAPDADRDLHNHPSWWRCFVLRGGYTQCVERLVVRDGFPQRDYFGRLWTDPQPHRARVRWWNTLDTYDYHRIVSVKPNTWTICFSGTRERSWGFLVDGRHVDHEEYRP